MARLTFADKMRLEKLFGMQGGYVLDFSNATFRLFVFDSVGKNVYDEKYSRGSGSKANRLRAFWDEEPDSIAAKLISDLVDHSLFVNPHNIDEGLLNECRRIVERLKKAGAPIETASKVATPVTTHLTVQPPSHTSITVFLCHASQDKASARSLASRLREQGFDPWLDEEKLLPGQRWDLEITRALRTSHAVVVCLSQQSINKVGYVQKEVSKALDFLDHQPEGSIFLIPIQLEECEIPDRLSHLHVARLYHDHGFAQLVAALTTRASELRRSGQL